MARSRSAASWRRAWKRPRERYSSRSTAPTSATRSACPRSYRPRGAKRKEGVIALVAFSDAVSRLPAGAHTITAVYSGDANYQGGSATFDQEVDPADQAITFAP